MLDGLYIVMGYTWPIQWAIQFLLINKKQNGMNTHVKCVLT